MGEHGRSPSGGSAGPRLCELGPLGFRCNGEWHPVTGERSAIVVAALSLAGAHGTRTDELVEDAWPEADRPASARQSLANLIARLRGRVGAQVVETVGHGYRLGSAVTSDRAEFEQAVLAASTASDDPAAALHRAEQALALWRGEPWVGIEHPEGVAPDRARLHALHREARRVRAVALCSLHRYREALPDLEELVDHSPEEETSLACAIALHEAGRRADALQVLADSRREAHDRGLSPSATLDQLEARLLDPTPSRHAPRPAPPPLPLGPERLLGRAALVAHLQEVVSDRRSVTLTGPAGVGKTTTAVAVARALPNDRPVFVDLSAVRDHRQVEAEVATSVGVDPAITSPTLDAVADALAAAGTRLLVVDNCEHLLATAATAITDLLARLPTLTVLATSREPLGTVDERVVVVEPLGADDDAAPSLFVERARDVGVELDVDVWRSQIAEICRRLDGLPLAIELAARRTVTLGPDEILAGLDERFALLRDTTTGRGRTLRDAIAWSWDLLDDEERTVLTQLAVFGSGATSDALEETLGWTRWRVVDVVERLTTRSLVSIRRRAGRPARSALLESVRDFALTVADEPLLTRLRRAHLRWIDGYTEAALAGSGRSPTAWNPMADLDAEAVEIREALDFAAAHDAADAATGLAVAGRLTDWWRARDAAAEAVDRLGELGSGASLEPSIEVAAIATRATMERIAGIPPDDASIRRAQDLLDRIEAPADRNNLELRLVEATFEAADPTLPDRLRRVIDTARALGTSEATTAFHLLTAWTLANRPAEAPALAEATAASARDHTLACQGHADELRGLAAIATDVPERAPVALRAALDRFVDIEQRFCAVHCCESVAWYLARSGRADDARRLAAATAGVRTRSRRLRAGFEEQAIDGLSAELGSLPDPDPTADLTATIDLARSLLDDVD